MKKAGAGPPFSHLDAQVQRLAGGARSAGAGEGGGGALGRGSVTGRSDGAIAPAGAREGVVAVVLGPRFWAQVFSYLNSGALFI